MKLFLFVALSQYAEVNRSRNQHFSINSTLLPGAALMQCASLKRATTPFFRNS
jgi:hypothetical protein